MSWIGGNYDLIDGRKKIGKGKGKSHAPKLRTVKEGAS
jgi:hypothetical protein